MAHTDSSNIKMYVEIKVKLEMKLRTPLPF